MFNDCHWFPYGLFIDFHWFLVEGIMFPLWQHVLQAALSNRGFDPGPADGVFGPMTLSAVLSYQRYEKLWVDGLVGPKTKAALGMG